MRKLLLLCGLVIALGLAAVAWWFFGAEPGPRDTAPVATVPSDTAKSTADGPAKQAPTNELPDPIRLPESTNHTITDLMEGLMTAADEFDNVALMEIRAMLLARDQVEVARAARAQIVIEREQPSTRLPAQRVCRLGHLLLLTKGEGDPPALTELRRRWSEPEIAQGRLANWTLINRRPVGERASMALAEEDRVETGAVSYAILLELSWGQGGRPGVLSVLRNAYKSGIPAGEVPDPWVSEVVDRVARQRSEIQAGQWDALAPCLRTLHDLEGVSGRLRAQIAALFVEKPGSFWELMEALNSVNSVEAAARALIGLMYSRALSTDEVDMFLALFRQKFGWDSEQYSQLMRWVIRDSRNFPREHVQELASSLLQIAHDSDDPYHWNTAMSALYGMRFATIGSVSGDNLLSRPGTDFKELLRALNRKAVKSENVFGKGLEGWSAAIILDLVWTMDAPVDEKIMLAIELIKTRSRLLSADVSWTMNGLERVKADIHPALGPLVATLIEETISRADWKAVLKSWNSPESGPIRPFSVEACVIDQCIGALAAGGYPVIGEVSRDLLVSWARRVIEYYELEDAATSDEEDIGRPIRASANNMIEKYGS
ncbi:MAG: hypothetical protein IT464_06820 [Planctomycetes bacterium]|nr:hypothetical protein [Planctomycetota bacterium]